MTLDALYHLVEILVLLLLGIRWSYQSAKKIDHVVDYVKLLEENHIPHLQKAISAICKKLGIEEESI